MDNELQNFVYFRSIIEIEKIGVPQKEKYQQSSLIFLLYFSSLTSFLIHIKFFIRKIFLLLFESSNRSKAKLI